MMKVTHVLLEEDVAKQKEETWVNSRNTLAYGSSYAYL
jgi:hypothetical protein